MILLGDCLDELKKLDDCSVDAVVTDPPYGLNFMGKKWDYDVPSTDVWCEVLRVLKPGGHLLSFFGTRTYHRGVVRIEDAGFEIRDQIQWIYGSGFPKSMDVSKAIDKQAGAERDILGPQLRPDGSFRFNILKKKGTSFNSGSNDKFITNPSTNKAKQWQGWGTALKPANEPIVLARKPISEKTVADNVLKWRCGAINVDESRIEGKLEGDPNRFKKTDGGNFVLGKFNNAPVVRSEGRWPANVMFDEQAAFMLDEQSNNVSRFFYCAKASKSERNAGLEGMPTVRQGVGDERPSGQSMQRLDGREAREMQNHHPTVKPIKLMEYLIKLITPPNGIVLDPFMGSGSTGVAANNLGFNFIGIELNKEYFEIAKKRIESNLKLI